MIQNIEKMLLHITEFPVLGQFLLSAVAAAVTEEWSTLAVFGLARAGKVGWGMALGSVFTGTVVLNTALWYAGRLTGIRALHWKMFSSLRKDRMEALRHHVHREGWIAVAVSRFVPGTRVPIFVLTGILGMEAHIFVFTLVGSTLLWMLATLGLVHLAVELTRQNPWLLAVGATIIVVAAAFLVRVRQRNFGGK
jgi:membrane protein DedA with SNARE-associated domain